MFAAPVSRRDVAFGLATAGVLQTPPQIPLLALDQDFAGRPSVDVVINGRGPFKFAVDSAATASVIASDLAEALQLPRRSDLMMHTLIGEERVGSVWADHLAADRLSIDGCRLAVGDRTGLIGMDGLLGLDQLVDRRVIMTFRGGDRLHIGASRIDQDGFLSEPRPRVMVNQRDRRQTHGLFVVDAYVRGLDAKAVIDTGAQTTLVNSQLARLGRATRVVLRSGANGALVQSPTGAVRTAEAWMLPAVRLPGVALDRLPVLVGDFHTFARLGMADKPAMLLGVDALRLFQRVVIDLKRGEMILER